MKIDIAKGELQTIRDIVYKGRGREKEKPPAYSDERYDYGVALKLITKLNVALKKSTRT